MPTNTPIPTAQACHPGNTVQLATITLNIVPFIPTPTPLPTAVAWNPADTAQLATVRLTETSQSIADFTIYRLITWLPWLLFLALIALPAREVYRRYRHIAPAKAPLPAWWQDLAQPDDTEQES